MSEDKWPEDMNIEGAALGHPKSEETLAIEEAIRADIAKIKRELGIKNE